MRSVCLSVIQTFDHLSWLGLYKDLSGSTALDPFWNKTSAPHKSDQYVRDVMDKAEQLGSVVSCPVIILLINNLHHQRLVILFIEAHRLFDVLLHIKVQSFLDARYGIVKP